ncbi:hypothetical protein EDD18DRAFT_1107506 [Armillaria luteobubalina]|uniref:Uncharacterized protein n=1 Tax=Armillaria luteobubalina TaxID=153913 RepID=A0AA39Q0H6_9AGAR|nr:hypothetical protein EDD18DRAFT_1107506 [Armillaria luteobubalina]
MQRDPVISVPVASYHTTSTYFCHQQHYVALGGPHAGLYDSLILPITIKAGPDNADLLADLVELFPEHAHPNQMARIIERSDKVGEVSNQIKSKIYCMLDGKTAFRKVRMIFVTNNFKEVKSFLNNGNTWKQETSLCKGLLYMLQNFQGAEPYIPITPPEPNISRWGSNLSPMMINGNWLIVFQLFRLIQMEVLCPSNFGFSSANLNAFVYVNY